jgi:hypothetical protein
MGRRTAACALVLVLGAAGCGSDDGRGGTDADVAVDSGPGAVDAGGVDGGSTLDSAVPDDGSTSLDGSPATDGGLSFACSVDELRPIVECAAAACVSLPDASLSLEAGLPDASLPDPGELATCILTSCGTLLLGVSPDCRDCLIAGVGMNLEEISMRCANGLPTP